MDKFSEKIPKIRSAVLSNFFDTRGTSSFPLMKIGSLIITGEISTIENLFFSNKVFTRSIGMFSYHE